MKRTLEAAWRLSLVVIVAATGLFSLMMLRGLTLVALGNDPQADCWVYYEGEKERFDYSRPGCEKRP